MILAGLVQILRWTLAKDAGACHFELVGTNGRRNELFFAGKKKLRGAHLSVLKEGGEGRPAPPPLASSSPPPPRRPSGWASGRPPPWSLRSPHASVVPAAAARRTSPAVRRRRCHRIRYIHDADAALLRGRPLAAGWREKRITGGGKGNQNVAVGGPKGLRCFPFCFFFLFKQKKTHLLSLSLGFS